MRFDNSSSVEECVWDMRLADEPRAADRRVILRQFNGNPPYDENTAEENNIQINLNNLEGPNLLSQARTQWENAFLKPSNYFTATTDSGPSHKRAEWASYVTKHANRILKRNRAMVGQVRGTGAQTMLYGIGPVNWKDRRSPIPKVIPVGSLMVPSETEIDDFDESLMYFAIFREWNAAMLWDLTHGTKVDPGWNMELVNAQWQYIKDELRKSPNSLAYQYMPERIEELVKQDKGYLGSDAVPTVDVWDFYFREPESGDGWYRRVILDWNVGSDISMYKQSKTMPTSRNVLKNGDKTFLYTSGKRKYGNSVGEILHCQFGDCSAYAPFKYHSIRSLGWMLWGVCDLQNRLHCKFNEGVFEQLMWFFQTAGNADLLRLKKANFEHMGIIPQGIKFLTSDERYVPNANLIQMAFNRNRQLMQDSSTTYTRAYDQTETAQARTATETMAIVNASQALSAGILERAYTYEDFKNFEIFRRLCLKNSTDKMAREFRQSCLKDGVPEEMLDPERWRTVTERVMGGGNKTIQMAQVQFLNTIRQNLPPDGQRLVDHISVEAVTDQPDLAEKMAPLGENRPISGSTHDAQLATQRLLRGLPFQPPKDAVFEDYVTVWLHDLSFEIMKAFKKGGMVSPDELVGMGNLAQVTGSFIEQMGENPNEKDKVREYQDALGQLQNHLKGLAQRLQEQMKKQAAPGAEGGDGKDMAKIQAMMMQAKAKAENTREAHAQRTQQRQIAWEKEQQRKDLQAQADIAREGIKTRHELMANRLRALVE